jgi:hypothetical protein
MKLSRSQQEKLRQIMTRRNDNFSDLTVLAGVDKRTAFIGADLRGVDFGTSDLAGLTSPAPTLRMPT